MSPFKHSCWTGIKRSSSDQNHHHTKIARIHERWTIHGYTTKFICFYQSCRFGDRRLFTVICWPNSPFWSFYHFRLFLTILRLLFGYSWWILAVFAYFVHFFYLCISLILIVSSCPWWSYVRFFALFLIFLSACNCVSFCFFFHLLFANLLNDGVLMTCFSWVQAGSLEWTPIYHTSNALGSISWNPKRLPSLVTNVADDMTINLELPSNTW